jgi:hypothetical protein
MTLEEKLAIYKSKEQTVDDLSKFFRKSARYPSVATIEYGVCSENGKVADDTCFEEWILVHFVPFSGKPSVSPCKVTGKSIVEISRKISKLIDGSYCDEIGKYVEALDHGYKFIDLD